MEKVLYACGILGGFMYLTSFFVGPLVFAWFMPEDYALGAAITYHLVGCGLIAVPLTGLLTDIVG